MQLADQVVVITGASRGLGAATARELIAGGAQVALLGRDEKALRAVTEPLGDRAAWFIGDVTDQASMEKAALAVEERFGRVDTVFANAGIMPAGTLRTIGIEQVQAVFDTNVVGAFRTLQVFLPALMRSKGHALLMSSIASSLGLGGQVPYASSKAAIEMMAHTLRMETAHLGITVGAVHPWFADTEMLSGANAEMPSFAKVRKRLAFFGNFGGPVGLIGLTLTPEECATEIADMIAKRSRKRHIPRSAGMLATARPVLNSGFGEAVQQLMFGWLMRKIDAEAHAQAPTTPR